MDCSDFIERLSLFRVGCHACPPKRWMDMMSVWTLKEDDSIFVCMKSCCFWLIACSFVLFRRSNIIEESVWMLNSHQMGGLYWLWSYCLLVLKLLFTFWWGLRLSKFHFSFANWIPGRFYHRGHSRRLKGWNIKKMTLPFCIVTCSW